MVGRLTRLTDLDYQLLLGNYLLVLSLTNDKWIDYFNLYKEIPEYKEQNFNMTLSEFKIIFW